MKTYCFLRSNERVRSAIKLRMDALGMNANALAEKSGINPTKLYAYLRDDQRDKARFPTQDQIYFLCKELGITLDITVKLDESWNSINLLMRGSKK